MLSNRPGDTFEPVTAIRIGWNASRGFSPSRSASSASAASIPSADHGSTVCDHVGCRREEIGGSVEAVESGSTGPKRKPANAGNSPSRAIFSWTSGAAWRTSASSHS